MKRINFKHWANCEIRQGVYSGGAIALQLWRADVGPIATATVNVPDFDLPDGCVLIKNWAENEGMIRALSAAGVVDATGETVPCGFTFAHVARLLIDPCTLNAV